jgi:hypothetical protein
VSPTSYADTPTVTVHLREFPVPLAAKAREVSENVLREFALITAEAVDNAGADAAGNGVPMRLLDLVVSLTQELHELIDVSSRRVEAAIASGSQTIADHLLEWPVERAADARAVADMWDEADQYCWSRERLAQLAAPADIAAYRRWFFAQVLDQLDGRGPVPWPESAAARGL